MVIAPCTRRWGRRSTWARSRHFRAAGFYSILDQGMKKRKPSRFSATKAVKANAREQIGQPKPSRVLADKPRVGRAAKHKPGLEEILREHE